MSCFETTLKVRSYECDLYGHVNNATFLNYLEYARVEFLNEMGFDLESLKKIGFLLPIVRIEIEYKDAVFAGEHLKITIRWLQRGRSSSTFKQEIIRISDDKLISLAFVTWVVTDLRGKPISIPDVLTEAYQKKFGDLPPKKTSS